MRPYKFNIGDIVDDMLLLERESVLRSENQTKTVVYYTCKCLKCGRVKKISTACLSKRTGTTHKACSQGLVEKYPKIYKTWNASVMRIVNKNDNRYYMYGGRGLTHDFPLFIDFFDYMYPSYAELIEKLGDNVDTMNITLERIDNDKGYIRGNIEWATQRKQGKNKSTNKCVTLRNLQTDEVIHFKTQTDSLHFLEVSLKEIKKGQIIKNYIVEDVSTRGKVDNGINKEQQREYKHDLIIPVELENIETGEVLSFEAVSYCCKHLGITSDKLHRLFRDDEPYNGYRVKSIKRNNTNKRNVNYKGKK